jgi:hypothetical protein
MEEKSETVDPKDEAKQIRAPGPQDLKRNAVKEMGTVNYHKSISNPYFGNPWPENFLPENELLRKALKFEIRKSKKDNRSREKFLYDELWGAATALSEGKLLELEDRVRMDSIVDDLISEPTSDSLMSRVFQQQSFRESFSLINTLPTKSKLLRPDRELHMAYHEVIFLVLQRVFLLFAKEVRHRFAATHCLLGSDAWFVQMIGRMETEGEEDLPIFPIQSQWGRIAEFLNGDRISHNVSLCSDIASMFPVPRPFRKALLLRILFFIDWFAARRFIEKAIELAPQQKIDSVLWLRAAVLCGWRGRIWQMCLGFDVEEAINFELVEKFLSSNDESDYEKELKFIVSDCMQVRNGGDVNFSPAFRRMKQFSKVHPGTMDLHWWREPSIHKQGEWQDDSEGWADRLAHKTRQITGKQNIALFRKDWVIMAQKFNAGQQFKSDYELDAAVDELELHEAHEEEMSFANGVEEKVERKEEKEEKEGKEEVDEGVDFKHDIGPDEAPAFGLEHMKNRMGEIKFKHHNRKMELQPRRKETIAAAKKKRRVWINPDEVHPQWLEPSWGEKHRPRKNDEEMKAPAIEKGEIGKKSGNFFIGIKMNKRRRAFLENKLPGLAEEVEAEEEIPEEEEPQEEAGDPPEEAEDDSEEYEPEEEEEEAVPKTEEELKELQMWQDDEEIAKDPRAIFVMWNMFTKAHTKAESRAIWDEMKAKEYNYAIPAEERFHAFNVIHPFEQAGAWEVVKLLNPHTAEGRAEQMQELYARNKAKYNADFQSLWIDFENANPGYIAQQMEEEEKFQAEKSKALNKKREEARRGRANLEAIKKHSMIPLIRKRVNLRASDNLLERFSSRFGGFKDL